MKKGLVLAGGGAKGAYHIGALIALKECDKSFDIVVGTSIGALIGCMVAQNEVDEVIELFSNLKVENIIEGGVSINENFESMVQRRQEVYRFFKQTINERSVNIEPFIQLINESANYEKLMSSNIDFGLVTYQISKNKPLMLTKKDFTKENLPLFLLASASCFPAFPLCTIDNEQYIDGGYIDNCPVSLAMDMGADEMIVVELNNKITHPEFIGRPNIQYIYPKTELGSFLDFERIELDRRISLGYYDTLKAFKKIDGVNLNFYKDSLSTKISETYYKNLLKYEIALNKGKFRKTLNPFKDQPCTSFLKNYGGQAMLKIEEYAMIALDACAMTFYGYSDRLMNAEETMNSCVDYYNKHSSEFEKMRSDLSSLTIKSLKKIFKDLSTSQLICIISMWINDNEISGSQLLVMGLFPKEFALALLLSVVTIKE